MKLSLTSIQKFKSDASHIKTNPIIPILGYIKFEKGTITKNNLKEFIIQECDDVDMDFLIEEKILFNFLSVASDDLTFKVSAKKVTLTDGKISVSSPTEDINLFPSTKASFNDLELISTELLTAIGISARFVIEDETNGIKSHVFIGKGHVAASDGFIAYLNPIDKVPEIILDKTSAFKVGSLPIASFTSNDSYNFFQSGKTIYGFIKPEQNFFDLSQMLKVPKDASFKISKESLIKFNDACITSSPAKSVTSRLEIVEGVMVLSMKDDDFNIDVDQRIENAGKTDSSFGYNPFYMNRLLKAVPESELTFYQASNKYFITGNNFTSLIMQLI